MQRKIHELEVNLFKRPYTSADNERLIKEQLGQKLNVQNLHLWTEKKTSQNFVIEYEQDYLAYRFEVLWKWIKIHERINMKYLLQLINNINSLMLYDMLYAPEKDYIDNLESINFAKQRNVKKLIVDFQLQPEEKALFMVDEVDAYKIDIQTNKKQLIQKKLTLHLTNQAIVIHNMFFEHRIPYVNSLSFKLTKDGIKWYAKEFDFEFNSINKYVLYEYIKIIVYKILPNNLRPFHWRNGYLKRD